MKKICSNCHIEKYLYNFNAGKNQCKECTNAKRRKRYKPHPKVIVPQQEKRRRKREYRKTLDGRYKEWKHNATRRNIPWDLTLNYLETFPQVCFYSGNDLTFESHCPNTISLDRIDSNKGYVIGNVVFCCSIVNYMKQRYSSIDFVDMCEKVFKNKERILKQMPIDKSDGL